MIHSIYLVNLNISIATSQLKFFVVTDGNKYYQTIKNDLFGILAESE